MQFWAPRYWPVWALWLWMHIIAAMPLRFALRLHKRLGRILYRVYAKRNRVARRNLEVCFPELSPREIDNLVRQHFESLGASFAETAFAWCAPQRRIRNRFSIVGLEHLEAALERKRGVILFTGHFTSLEICGRPFKDITLRFALMFSRRRNRLMDEIQRRGRLRIAHESFMANNVRTMLKSLKRNAVVWYAPDQAQRGKNGALIPFFGVPAMTNVATSKIARLTGATVLPFSYRRLEDDSGYELRFMRPLRNFPSDDSVADTGRLIELLEGFIRCCPEQYFWIHRKFDGRPPDFPDLYRAGDADPLQGDRARRVSGMEATWHSPGRRTARKS